MGVTITSEAVALIRRSLELAQLDPGQSGVRLRIAGGEVRPRFAPCAEPDDEVIEAGGIRVFVDPSILKGHPEVEIDVSSEHEQLIVRPVTP